jgi:cerevisin
MLKIFFLCLVASSTNVYKAPLFGAKTKKDTIPNEYIVKFKNGLEPNNEVATNMLSQCDFYKILFQYPFGFAVFMNENCLDFVRSFIEVEYVERNERVSIHGSLSEQENPASWGLPRIYQRIFEVEDKYVFPSSSGENVDVYVIDTGVFLEHDDFEGRASWGYSSVPGETTDYHGHGTHVASTIAGKLYGVAKKSKIIAVRVLDEDGYGSTAQVIAGISYVTERALRGRRRKSVANMSLGGSYSHIHNFAVLQSIEAGVHYVVAAGNSRANACDFSPSSVSRAITVGASTIVDNVSSFSNFGICVDIFAPGSNIVGAWIGKSDSFRTLSGTSMASPHVAGVVALFLSEKNYSTKEMAKKIVKVSTKGVLKLTRPDTINALVYNKEE